MIDGYRQSWQNKVAVINQFAQRFDGLTVTGQQNVLNFLVRATDNYKEQNHFIIKAIFELMSKSLTELNAEFSLQHVCKLIASKAGDKKYFPDSEGLIKLAIAVLPFHKIFDQLYGHCTANPKQLETANALIRPLIGEKISVCMAQLVATAKGHLNHPNQQTRNSFVEVVKAFAPLLGAKTKQILEQIENKIFRKNLESELAAISPQAP